MSTLQIFKDDFYNRIGGLEIFKGKNVLDVGCGDGIDSIAIAKYAKKVVGLDIYKDSNWKKINIKNMSFILSKAEKTPFANKKFNGIFLKDVLHHVKDIEKSLNEIKRVASDDAIIMLIEGNRYNPLFYLHMTKMHGHQHLTQQNFKKIVLKYFPDVIFIHFESHFIPFLNKTTFRIFIFFERLIGKISFLEPFLSYNAAIKK